MCGICGILNTVTIAPVNGGSDLTGALIKKYTKRMRHRGPDESGFYSDHNVSLGMRRLKIIDLDTGSQPVFSENRDCVTVFNGEIYNFRELRKELAQLGHRFYTSGDTEVIVHLYQTHGPGFLQKLNGMFAIALWDIKKQTLMLARDRAGQKPLYIWNRPDKSIAFASEMKCFLDDPDFNETPCSQAVHHYLSLGYIPEPMSIYKSVYKLMPAHYIIFNKNAPYDQARQVRYWQPHYSIKSADSFLADPMDNSESDPLHGRLGSSVMRLFEDSVKKRMISDVPLGAFLSGGIDSAAVVSVMSRLSSKPVTAFTIGFKDPRYNEVPLARAAAEKFKCRHLVKIIDPARDVKEIMETLAYQYDEPYSDSSALPTWHLSKMASEHVTVALNGDGGDELFGGYERYRAWMVLTLLQRIKGVKGLMSGAQDIFRFLECLGRPQSRTFLNRLKRFLSVSQSNPDAAYTNWTTIFTGPEKSRIYSELMNPCKGLNSFEWTYRAMNLCTSSDEGEKLLCSDFHTYLPGDLLKKVDIASMAWSLECRSPFLDHRLISRAAALPMNMKANVFKNKIILKKLFENIIPKEIINAPKRGFGIPIDHWFRNDLKDWSRSVILDSPDMVWFNKKELNKLLDSHLKGQNTGFKIWSLVMLSLWCSKFKK